MIIIAEYIHEGHTVHDIKYHFAWLTKYKHKALTPVIKIRLKELLVQGCETKNITILGGNIGADHVHMLVSCPTNLSPSQIAQHLKGRSSRLLQEEFPELKEQYRGQHLWARGYFCVTVGDVAQETIQNYMDSQFDEP